MSKHLQHDLERLKKRLVTVGSMVEAAIQKAIAALHERRPELAQEVVDGDREVDRWEVEIEEDCLKILALHQPVAYDLRFIAAVMKTNNDLERIADLAVNIAERSLSLAALPPIPVPRNLRPMTSAALRMVRESLDAFVNRDAVVARRILSEDDEVDAYNREIIAELRRMMIADPGTIERATHLFSICRHVERIADHATNVAEDVVYMVEGEIIRHAAKLAPRPAPPAKSPAT